MGDDNENGLHVKILQSIASAVRILIDELGTAWYIIIRKDS